MASSPKCARLTLPPTTQTLSNMPYVFPPNLDICSEAPYDYMAVLDDLTLLKQLLTTTSPLSPLESLHIQPFPNTLSTSECEPAPSLPLCTPESNTEVSSSLLHSQLTYLSTFVNVNDDTLQTRNTPESITLPLPVPSTNYLHDLEAETYHDRNIIQAQLARDKGTADSYPRHLRTYRKWFTLDQDRRLAANLSQMWIQSEPITATKVAAFLAYETKQLKVSFMLILYFLPITASSIHLVVKTFLGLWWVTNILASASVHCKTGGSIISTRLHIKHAQKHIRCSVTTHTSRHMKLQP